mmetsp:Transcript_101005/g.324329  ORF Transcript_101005/g.324329 Transcript_101005/m.324329 type:complete len:221 (+) Transcript_101005:223-885(+)
MRDASVWSHGLPPDPWLAATLQAQAAVLHDRALLAFQREHTVGVALDDQCREVVNADALLPRVPHQHLADVLGPGNAVALHSVVMRADQPRQEAQAWHSDVLPVRAFACLVARFAREQVRGGEVGVGVHGVGVPAVEPADGPRRAARQHRAPQHGLAQQVREPKRVPAVHRPQSVAAAHHDDFSLGNRRLHFGHARRRARHLQGLHLAAELGQGTQLRVP